MSEAFLLRQVVQPVNKPGTSCLGCRRRKLKCSREAEGCNNCVRSELPCVYPTPEVGIKRKRGPYRKDKPPRQRHLEDLINYLEPKNSGAEANEESSAGNSHHSSSPRLTGHRSQGPLGESYSLRPSGQSADAEELVKDALNALTRSSASDHDSRLDHAAVSSRGQMPGLREASSTLHPPVRQVLEYWQIFTVRVDPVTKVIHCPTLGKKLFGLVDDLSSVSRSTEALLFSVYYTAVATCTARECRRRFAEPQDTLLERYGNAIESAIGDSYDIPELEAMQALVLYIVDLSIPVVNIYADHIQIAIRRKDDAANVRALFTLAVRSAQIIGLHKDPLGEYSPYEVELRRRLWFHLYGLESRTAEESGTRSTSIMQNLDVQMPSNLNDRDIDPGRCTPAKARDGVTDLSFVLLRFEIHRLVYNLWVIRRQRNGSWQSQSPVREDQLRYLEESQARLHSTYLTHMDNSRPYDLMCMLLVEGMLLKAQLIIDFPFGTVPTKTMPSEERMSLLRASVDIIRGTHLLATDERLGDWLWYFRGFTQWHSLGIVVAELNISTNHEFVEDAWQVLDPILTNWDSVYRAKKEEPAWEHVNSLIERARIMRKQKAGVKEARQSGEKRYNPCGSPINAQAIMPVHERPSPFTLYQGSLHDESELPSQVSPQTTNPVVTPYDSTGFAPSVDMGFTPFENMEDIDFSAFSHVFGSGDYDFLDPLGSLEMQVDEGGMAGMLAGGEG